MSHIMDDPLITEELHIMEDPHNIEAPPKYCPAPAPDQDPASVPGWKYCPAPAPTPAPTQIPSRVPVPAPAPQTMYQPIPVASTPVGPQPTVCVCPDGYDCRCSVDTTFEMETRSIASWDSLVVWRIFICCCWSCILCSMCGDQLSPQSIGN